MHLNYLKLFALRHSLTFPPDSDVASSFSKRSAESRVQMNSLTTAHWWRPWCKCRGRSTLKWVRLISMISERPETLTTSSMQLTLRSLAFLVAHWRHFCDVFSSNVAIRVCRDQERLATRSLRFAIFKGSLFLSPLGATRSDLKRKRPRPGINAVRSVTPTYLQGNVFIGFTYM